MSDTNKSSPHSGGSVAPVVAIKAVAESEENKLIIYEVKDEPPSGACGCGDSSKSTTEKKTLTFVGTYDPVDTANFTDDEKAECEYDIVRFDWTISLQFQK